MNAKVEISKQNLKNGIFYEPIFESGKSQEKLDETEVLYSIYNDIRPEKSITKLEEDWNTQMTCTQEWFIRCSWINKLLFLEVLCRSTSGCAILENILQSLESILSKDVLESHLRESSNFVYDRIPTDDNRALKLAELNTVMQTDVLWFLCSNPSSQIRIILRLLRLGGGGLIFTVFKMVEKIYQERKANFKLSTDSSMSKVKRITSSRVRTKSSSKSHASRLTIQTVDTEREISALNIYAYEKKKQLQRREEELFKYKKLKGILVEDAKSLKKKEIKETVDYLQILPIWLNRKIMSYIDDKTLSGFKKVGKYWGKMIDESINEKSGRKAINAKINKITGIKVDKEERKNENKKGDEKLEYIVELGGEDLIIKRNENEKKLYALSEFFDAMFSKKCEIYDLDSSFYPKRCGSFDSVVWILACTNPNNSVQFFSARTGARLSFLIFSVKTEITCVALHENRTTIFVGCKNGSLISRDIRTNKETASLLGHKNAILSILTTSSNLLSASLDNTIKYFQLWSGTCLLCVDLKKEYNVSSALLFQNKKPVAVIGTVEGFLIFVDFYGKKFLGKVQLHSEEIKHMILDGDMLITGSPSGEIRVWDLNHLKDNLSLLTPYYNIKVGVPVSCLKLYKNQIFSGCENGTIKIISLANGKIYKVLKISSPSRIKGLDIAEDKFFIKLIIWHDNGVEIRSFSISPVNRQTKHKTGKQTKRNRESEIVLNTYFRNSQGFFDPTPITHKRTTFKGKRNPLNVRCCTLSDIRSEGKNLKEFNTSVFTKAHSEFESTCFMTTFPRYNNTKG